MGRIDAAGVRREPRLGVANRGVLGDKNTEATEEMDDGGGKKLERGLDQVYGNGMQQGEMEAQKTAGKSWATQTEYLRMLFVDNALNE